MGYILELRKTLGSRPLIMAGAGVILINDKNELIWQTGNNKLDFHEKIEYKMDGCTILIDYNFDMNELYLVQGNALNHNNQNLNY